MVIIRNPKYSRNRKHVSAFLRQQRLSRQIAEGGETRLWTPADTTTINWFDADDASTITDGGGLVSTWADKSGGAHDLTATAQPQTGITSINGLNTLYFDGSDFMSNASFPIPTSGNLAIYTYAKIDLINDNVDSLFSMDGATNDFQFEADNDNNFIGKINRQGVFFKDY